MLKTFPIDFVRQAIEQKLLEEHIKDLSFFGGKDQVNILSFYEQLKSQDEVDRFVETYRDLADQQNRTGLILNGVVLSPENPTYTNLYSATIIPLTFTCSLRCTLENRDQSIITINNLIDKLKGRKVDIAQLNCVDENGKPYSTPFVVGTIGQNSGASILKNGDYLGTVTLASQVETIIDTMRSNNLITYTYHTGDWFYVTYESKLTVAYWDGDAFLFLEDDGTYGDIIFPPEHTSFDKYKLSFSFDAIRCDEPRNLNGEEYCELSFGGSATLANNGVKLGNDLLKISMHKNKIVAQTPIDLSASTTYYLEPLEMPSGSNANTQINQLMSNKFVANTHSDSLALTLQYTFIVDENIDLIKQLYKYGRYGKQALSTPGVNDISPNIIYDVIEYTCSWGVYEKEQVLAKIVGDIDIDNSESDVLTIGITMQIQGENN